MTNPQDQEEFMLVVAAQLRQRVWLSDFFDTSESHWILHKVIRKLFSQNQAKFENYFLNDDFDKLQKEEFFKP